MRADQFWASLRPDSSRSTVETFTVVGVGDDTVNLAYGDATIFEVPCNQAYFNRSEGDEVKVIVRPGSMYVEGKAGAPASGEVAWGNITGRPNLSGIVYGEGSPPEDGKGPWTPGLAEGVWVRGNAAYIQVGAGGGAGGDAGGSGTPDPVTVKPTGSYLYQSGHLTDAINAGLPVQGSWGGEPENRGLYCYGSENVDKCAGKTPDAATIHLSRRATGGRSGGVPVHLFLVDDGTPPSAWPSGHDPWSPGRLKWGTSFSLLGSTKAYLPQLFVDRLSSGASRALLVRSGRGQDYIRFGSGGEIRWTFK